MQGCCVVDELNVEFREEKGTMSSFVSGPKNMNLGRGVIRVAF